jgi:hypothetical protein
MSEGALVPGRRAARLAAMHPAAAVAHGRGAARAALTGLCAASGSCVQCGGVSNHLKDLLQVHGVERRKSHAARERPLKIRKEPQNSAKNRLKSQAFISLTRPIRLQWVQSRS